MQNNISEIFKKEELILQKRIENLSLFSGFILFSAAIWCMLPIFSSNIDPLKVLTPAREWGMSREETIAYGERFGIPAPVSKNSPYSIDLNLLGRSIEAGSLEAAMLFNETTFIVPNAPGLVMTNGARVEFLNCFTYFASEGIKGVAGSVGIHSAGETRLRLTGVTTTSMLGIGNTITYYDTDGVTGLGTAVVSGYDGTYLDVTGKQLGFEILKARTAKTLTFNGDAQLDTSVKKFGSASLKLDGTNDSVSASSDDEFGFGTGEFAVGFWVYRNSTGLTSATAIDFRQSGTDTNGLSIAFRGNEYDVRVGHTTALSAASAGITTGAWHHIAVAKRGTKLIAYSAPL